MAKLDPNYLRFRKRVVPFKRKVSWQKWLVIAVTAIGILSSAVLLIRNAANLPDEFRPAPGSLIVNINTASEEELQTIPGIGAARAAQIVAGRPYESVDDLVTIVGIGEESIDGLRPFVTTDGETRKR